MQRHSFFEKFIFPISLIISLGALLSSIAPFISPQKSWFIALMGLGFPYLFVLNLFFLLMWIIKKKLFFLFSLIPFLVGLKTIPAIVQLNFLSSKKTEITSNHLKIMSFNVRVFDLYNWMGNYTGKSKTRQQIFELIENENPDIICFQEFYTCDTGKFQTVKIMTNDLKMKYAYTVLPIQLYSVDHFGMAIFSKFPLINKTTVNFNHKGSNMCLQSDVIIKNDTLRVFNCHLQSIRFGKDDYKFMNQIEYNIEEENLTGIKKIITRLKVAFKARATQVDTLEKQIKDSPYPVVLCGDFNDTPSSYSYNTLSRNLYDAFRMTGTGFGTTYTGQFPAFRIDFILHSKSINSFNYKTLSEKKLSDHYPVSCELLLGDK